MEFLQIPDALGSAHMALAVKVNRARVITRMSPGLRFTASTRRTGMHLMAARGKEHHRN